MKPAAFACASVPASVPGDGAQGGEDDVLAGLTRHVARQVFVRQEDDRLAAQRLDHGRGVAGGAADIRLGFHVGVGVDVGHHRHAGIARFQRAHILSGDAGGQ